MLFVLAFIALLQLSSAALRRKAEQIPGSPAAVVPGAPGMFAGGPAGIPAPQWELRQWRTPPPPDTNILLMPDWSAEKWRWVDADQQTPADLASILAGGSAGGPGAAPAPAGGASPAAGAPAGGPGGADPCPALMAAGEGKFVTCSAFRFQSWGALGMPPIEGCHCGAQSAECPFETCMVKNAWEDGCVGEPAAGLGFVSLSKQLDGAMTMCSYWLPKPAPLGMAVLPPPQWPSGEFYDNPFAPAPAPSGMSPAPMPFGMR